MIAGRVLNMMPNGMSTIAGASRASLLTRLVGGGESPRKTHTLLFAVCYLLFDIAASAAQPLAKQSDLGAYQIPFASEGNRIELEIVNSTGSALEDATVDVEDFPSWIRFEAASADVGTLKPEELATAIFRFDLDERAPVGEVGEVTFQVVRDDGERHLESRTIRIAAEAPTELTLRGNYPNPFNPTTKIAYALPADGRVEIEVFNAIGQRVARIADDLQSAGYREATWNASGVPSGVYFYSVQFEAETRKQVKLGKMVLLR